MLTLDHTKQFEVKNCFFLVHWKRKRQIALDLGTL